MFTEQKVYEWNEDNLNIKNAKWDTKEMGLWSNIKSLSQKWVKYQCVHSLEIEYHTI